jgi:hypothetical protein
MVLDTVTGQNQLPSQVSTQQTLPVLTAQEDTMGPRAPSRLLQQRGGANLLLQKPTRDYNHYTLACLAVGPVA